MHVEAAPEPREEQHGARGRRFEADVRHLAAIVRPSASDGEREAAEWIAARLKQLGAESRVERERAHGGYWWPIGLLNGAAAAAATLALRSGSQASRRRAPVESPAPPRRRRALAARLFAAAVGASAAAALWDDVSGGSHWFRRALPHRDTFNVVAEVGAGARDARRTLVLIAHHDAAHSGLVFHPRLPEIYPEYFPEMHAKATQGFPIMVLTWLGSVLTSLGALLGSKRTLRLACAFAGGSVAAMADIGLRRTVPGANDNLSSVAVLLAVAESLQQSPPPDGLRVILLSTGSEESFMEGMRGFARRHFDSLDRESTEMLCLECVGGPNLIVLEGEGMLRMRDYPALARERLADAARRAGIDTGRGLRTVAATDALIALLAGYEVAQLASVDHTKFPANYHWPSDTPENLRWDTIGEAIAVVEELVRGCVRHAPAPGGDPSRG